MCIRDRLEAGAKQLCKVGIHIQRGQQQLFGVGVGIVVVKSALGFLNIDVYKRQL